MDDREKAINVLSNYKSHAFGDKDEKVTVKEIIALLKEQEKATIEPKRIDLEEETKAWLDKMDAVDALGNIADICIDWDGYRTADGLGGLINEIWAYARYCSNRLAKEQEPRVITIADFENNHDLDDLGYLNAWVDYKDGNLCGWATICLKDVGEFVDVRRYWTSRPSDEVRRATPWN